MDGSEEQKPQRMRSTAYALIFAHALPTLQRIARDKGYALGIHGSMATDFDLIACPWTEEAASAFELADAVRECIGGHNRLIEGRPVDRNRAWKPHGRLAFTFYLSKTEDGTSYGPYIDLSVMPRRRDGEHYDNESSRKDARRYEESKVIP